MPLNWHRSQVVCNSKMKVWWRCSHLTFAASWGPVSWGPVFWGPVFWGPVFWGPVSWGAVLWGIGVVGRGAFAVLGPGLLDQSLLDHSLLRQHLLDQGTRDAALGGEGRGVDLGDHGRRRLHRLLHMQGNVADHVRFHRELAISEVLHQHGLEQGLVR